MGNIAKNLESKFDLNATRNDGALGFFQRASPPNNNNNNNNKISSVWGPVPGPKIGGQIALLSDPTVHSLHCVAIKKNDLFFTSLGFLCSLDVNIFDNACQ